MDLMSRLASGTSRNTYIQKLGARKLIVAVRGGSVRMSEELA